ncbi:hypothetical protein [Pseudomonas gorinensis]
MAVRRSTSTATSKFITPSTLDGAYTTQDDHLRGERPRGERAQQGRLGSASNRLYLQRNDSAKSGGFSLAGVSPAPSITPYVNTSGIDALVYRATSFTYEYDRYFDSVSAAPGGASANNDVITRDWYARADRRFDYWRHHQLGGFAWPGSISEILDIESALTNSNTRMVYDYLAAEWGFTTPRSSCFVLATA